MNNKSLSMIEYKNLYAIDSQQIGINLSVIVAHLKWANSLSRKIVIK